MPSFSASDRRPALDVVVGPAKTASPLPGTSRPDRDRVGVRGLQAEGSALQVENICKKCFLSGVSHGAFSKQAYSTTFCMLRLARSGDPWGRPLDSVSLAAQGAGLRGQLTLSRWASMNPAPASFVTVPTTKAGSSPVRFNLYRAADVIDVNSPRALVGQQSYTGVDVRGAESAVVGSRT